MGVPPAAWHRALGGLGRTLPPKCPGQTEEMPFWLVSDMSKACSFALNKKKIGLSGRGTLSAFLDQGSFFKRWKQLNIKKQI